MILNETFLVKPIIEEISRDKLPDGVLCRVVYPICDIGQKNANDRVYEDAVWDKVHGEKDLKEKLENRALFGHAEHPEQTQSNLEKTSHVIFEMWKENNQEWQKFDVVDTPTGRIVDCLLRADCRVGCSTRAEGDLEEAEDDEGNTYQRVIPDSYNYVTTDFTADPSTFGSVPHDIKRNIVSEVKKLLESKEVDGSEKEFGTCLLEDMRCKDRSKCQKCGTCQVLKENKQYIMEGVWALPNTVAKAKKLANLMKEPLSSAAVEDNLHSILGDDELWDKLKYHSAGKLAIGDDFRPAIKKRIKQYLADYEESPKDFKGKLEDEAKKILQGIVEKKTLLDLVNDKLIQVGKVVEYKDEKWKVTKIDEAVGSITISPDDEVRNVMIKQGTVLVDGNPAVVVDKEGGITITPALTTPAVEEPLPEEPIVEPPEEEAPPPVEPGTADAVIVGDEAPEVEDEVPESIEVGATAKIEEGEYKDKEGKVTKIEEAGITIALDDGTVVSIEDPTAVNITVTAPAPEEEIEPIEPPEEETEVEEPLPDERDRFESKVEEMRYTVKENPSSGWDVWDIKKDEHVETWEKEENAKANADSMNKNIREVSVESGVSDKLAAGNLLRDKEGKDWTVKEAGDGALTVTQPGEPGTEKRIEWKDIASYGFTKVSEVKVDEEKLPSRLIDKLIDFAKEHNMTLDEVEAQLAREFKEKTDEKESKVEETEAGEAKYEEILQDVIKRIKGGQDAAKLISDVTKSWGISRSQTIELYNKANSEEYLDTSDAWFESKVEEATSFEKGGEWFVKSPSGAILGGPYKSKIEADKRKKDVEFFVASKESKVDDDLHDKTFTCPHCDKEFSKKVGKGRSTIFQCRHCSGKLRLTASGEKVVKESISTTAKEIKSLRVEEASTRAERDKAIELLEEITDEKIQLVEKVRKEKAFEAKILVNKIEKTLEAKEREVDALRAKLEEKAKLAADLKGQVEEKIYLAANAQEELSEIKTNLSKDLESLKESISADEDKHQKEVLEFKEGHQEAIRQMTEANESKIEKAKEETEKRIREEVTKEFVKCFIEFRLSETGLKVDDNSRALLEKCTSLEEADDLLDEVMDASRRGALHSESISRIQIVNHEVVDPEHVEAKRRVEESFEGMGT